jgi:hypothetical protein
MDMGGGALVYGISRITAFVLPAEACLRTLLLLLFTQTDGLCYRWENSSATHGCTNIIRA